MWPAIFVARNSKNLNGGARSVFVAILLPFHTATTGGTHNSQNDSQPKNIDGSQTPLVSTGPNTSVETRDCGNNVISGLFVLNPAPSGPLLLFNSRRPNALAFISPIKFVTPLDGTSGIGDFIAEIERID